MSKASVPKLAKIVELLGGFESLEPGQSFIISLDKDRILRPVSGYTSDELAIAFPGDMDVDHCFKPLHITLFWEHEDTYSVHVHLDARVGKRDEHGDIYHDVLYDFTVPKESWASGEWDVRARQIDVPFLRSFYEQADSSDAKARELASEATQFDRESIIVDGCLRLIEKEMAAA
jgi:hypothetical protein